MTRPSDNRPTEAAIGAVLWAHHGEEPTDLDEVLERGPLRDSHSAGRASPGA